MYCPDGLHTTSLSQGCVLGTAPTMGTVGREGQEGGENLLIAQSQLMGQLEVTSSPLSPPMCV